MVKALVVTCTPKRSPEPSGTEAATEAAAVAGRLPEDGADVETVRAVDNEDGAHHVISEIPGALADIPAGAGLRVGVVDRTRLPFGRVPRTRGDRLRARGLVGAGTTEGLVVIRAEHT
ncbi:hypothetical protein AB0F77_39895 [Streptomyces sp. NPDC026672]|uniref:hypothetical protein n=1 Tax=unclassified Streptomyces TaxID=2593676 RepID=UPI0033F1CF07